jgi:YHS domain-containing protein
MGGLDPVQYFSFPDDTYVGVPGSKHYPYTYEGYRYYFINEENQLLFASDPDRYRPQWGGMQLNIQHRFDSGFSRFVC